VRDAVWPPTREERVGAGPMGGHQRRAQLNCFDGLGQRSLGTYQLGQAQTDRFCCGQLLK